MALALRPQHAAVGVVGAVLLRHAGLLYQAFLHQAGWGADSGVEAAVSAARKAAESATIAAAAVAGAGAARKEQCQRPPEWLSLPEPQPCPEPPACECRCEGVVEKVVDEHAWSELPAWQVLGSAVGHILVVSAGSGRAVGEEAFWSELLPGGYVAVFYSDDNVWHERLLLGQVDAQHWVIETPDHDMYVENILCSSPEDVPCRAVVLEDSGALLVFLRGRTYRFKEYLGEEDLLARLREAGQLTVEMGYDRSSTRWVSMETLGAIKRGDEIELADSDKVMGERALHRLPDGQVITACPASSLAAIQEVRGAGDGADARVLSPVVYDPGGRRWSEFSAAVSRMRVEPMGDFPLEGEGSALWLFQYVRDHGGAFDARQTKWAMEQRIAPDSTAFLMHDLVGLALDLSVCYDQCDGGDLASVEALARLYQLVEETSGTLQLEGIDHYLGRDRAGGLRRGVALNPSLAQCATEKKSKETEVMKQRRKAREEEEAAKKNKGGKSSAGKEATCDTIRAINLLAGFETPEVESVTDLNGPSALIYSDVRALRSARASVPGNSFTPKEAFDELLGSTPSTYTDGDESSPVRPYSRDLVKGNAPVPLATNAPLDSLQYLTEGQRDAWLRQPREVQQVRQDEGLPTLYGDANLTGDRSAYIGFIQDGLARGIFRLARRRKEAIQIFFVKKKDGEIRIVVDCRRSNQHFVDAPKVHLFSGSSFAEVEVPEGRQLFYAGGDVQNAFYQHRMPAWLQPYFGMDAVKASEVGIAQLDGQYLAGDTMLYPLMNVVPMGWKWALCIVQRIHEHVLDGVPELGPRRRAIDFRPPPLPEEGALRAVYVGNVLIEGRDRDEVTRLRRVAREALQAAGYATHDESDAAESMEMLGVVQQGQPCRVAIAAKRYWRLWKALEWWRFKNDEDPAGFNPRANALKDVSVLGVGVWEGKEVDFSNVYVNREFPEVPANVVESTLWSVERFQPVFTYEPMHVTEMPSEAQEGKRQKTGLNVSSLVGANPRAPGHPILGLLELKEAEREKELRLQQRRAARRLATHGELRDTTEGPGITEEASLTLKTRGQYKRLLSDFQTKQNVVDLSLHPAELDAHVVCYFDRLFLEGKAPSTGEKLIAAIQYVVPVYNAKGMMTLPRATRSLRGWRRLVPRRTRRPLPWEVVAAIAVNLLRMEGLGMALAWLLMVDTYMRPGECLDLKTSQVLRATSQRHMALAAILLHPAEHGQSSKVGAADESLIVSRPWLSDILMMYVDARPSGSPLWNFSLKQMNASFIAVCGVVGISYLKPVLYMGRHSGASLDRLHNRLDLAEVQRRGRWRSMASVRRYEKRALVQGVYNKLDQRSRRMCT
ncbi:unnamed protein product, partial [Prorocentrum cordatum]